MAIPYTLLDASSMASASVGCAWIVHTKSSTVASSSMAGDGFRDQFCRLRADDVDAEDLAISSSDDNFDEAFVRPTIEARELAVKGNLPIFTL